MALQAIIFDMDGVLTDTVEQHYQSWKSVFDANGIPFSRKDNDRLLGLTRRRSLETILGDRELPEERIQELLSKKNKVFLESVDQMSPQDLLPGVLPLLDEIRTARLKLGVASASRNAAHVLKQLGIVTYFEVLTDGNSSLRSKPAPDLYLHTARALKVSPEDCLAIEDGEAGIKAALAAGMCVIGVGPNDRVGRAHATFPDLTDIRLRLLRAVYELWLISKPSQSLDSYTQATI